MTTKRDGWSRREVLFGIGALAACGTRGSDDGALDPDALGGDGAPTDDGGGGDTDAGITSENPVIEMMPSYLSVVPGRASWGHDQGQGPARGGTAVFLVDNLTSTATTGGSFDSATGIGVGPMRWACRYPGPKVIIPIRSGYMELGETWLAATSNTTFAGQFAPGDGLIFRNGRCTSGDSTDMLFWHVQSYLGDDFAERNVGDATGGSGQSVARHVWDHCEMAWSMDEAVDYYIMNESVTLDACAVMEPLAQEHNHNFGALFDADQNRLDFNATRVAVMNTLFAHCSYRSPMMRVLRGAVANCTIYNNANVNGTGWGIQFAGPLAAPARTNAIRNLHVRGPNNGSKHNMIVSDGLPAGSRGGVRGNAVHGWSPTSQAELVTRANSSPTDWYSGDLLADAWPPAWVEDNFHAPAAGVVATNDEVHAWVDRFARVWGARPAHPRRKGRVAAIVQQIRNRVNGEGSAGGYVTDVEAAGGWPVLENTLVDPANPGTHWHAPLPPKASWATVHTSGTFPDGVSRVGYNVLDEWLYLQHLKVIGLLPT